MSPAEDVLLRENAKLKAQKEELREGLRNLSLAFKSLMETGRERILQTGGICDSVHFMLKRHVTFQETKALLKKHKPRRLRG